MDLTPLEQVRLCSELQTHIADCECCRSLAARVALPKSVGSCSLVDASEQVTPARITTAFTSVSACAQNPSSAATSSSAAASTASSSRSRSESRVEPESEAKTKTERPSKPRELKLGEGCPLPRAMSLADPPVTQVRVRLVADESERAAHRAEEPACMCQGCFPIGRDFESSRLFKQVRGPAAQRAPGAC